MATQRIFRGHVIIQRCQGKFFIPVQFLVLIMIVKIYKASFAQSIHLTSSDIDTYFYQSKLPKQPIPSLNTTGRNMKKYLKSLKSHQKFNAHEIDRFTELLEEFIQNEGFGS